MLTTKILATAVSSVALLAACTVTNTTTHLVPQAPLTSSEQACLDYGFSPGSTAYSNCVSREHEARLRGRVARDYAEARLAEDARDACAAYGLVSGTPVYDRCVGREIDERRYRAGA